MNVPFKEFHGMSMYLKKIIYFSPAFDDETIYDGTKQSIVGGWSSVDPPLWGHCWGPTGQYTTTNGVLVDCRVH